MVELTPLSPDRKLTSLDDDDLGYGPLAAHIADVIAAAPHDDGLVLAVYGPWGSGKSSFLEFVKEALRQREPAPIVLEFNPWWFSGEEDLARRLFEQLAASFQATDSWRKKVLPIGRELLSNQVAELAVLASTTPLPFANYVGIAGNALERLRAKPKDIQQLKRDIDKGLAALPSHVLVLVDDVDRLTPEEIRQLFKVVKSVGDLKNITYVIALDRQVAIDALHADRIAGRDYLEKIVQAAFELPLPDRVALRDMFLKGLDPVVGEQRLRAALDSVEWIEVFGKVEPFLTTPRNVGFLLNALRISYPLVADEVDVVDFIATEALHVFMPEVWDAIRRHAEYVTS